MVFPDSSWLEKLEKAPLSLLFSIAVAAGAVWWFLDLSKWSLVGAVFCFFTAISLCVLRIVTRAWQRFARWRANRLMRCFDELSEEQKDYICEECSVPEGVSSENHVRRVLYGGLKN